VYERTGTRKRGKSNARTGVYKTSIKRVMKSLDWIWTPTMQIGSGCTVHLRADELPSGRLVVSVSKHLTAVIDGCDPRYPRPESARNEMCVRILATWRGGRLTVIRESSSDVRKLGVGDGNRIHPQIKSLML